MDLGLQGKAFIVTGGRAGLGRAAAETLVGEGARVVVSGRDQATLDESVKSWGDSAVGVAADNADPAAADTLVETARSRFGRLDGALISVGGPPVGSVMSVTDEQWMDAFNTVFLGTVRMVRKVAENLSEGGSIAVVLSTSVREPLANLAISNGLRPGLAMVAKTLADELGPVGIRVNGLMPGRIATERVAWLDEQSADPAAARARWERQIPLRRYGEPSEFGRVAAFLLGTASSFITGAIVPVDGGMVRSL